VWDASREAASDRDDAGDVMLREDVVGPFDRRFDGKRYDGYVIGTQSIVLFQ
jgi:hypothetical protein